MHWCGKDDSAVISGFGSSGIDLAQLLYSRQVGTCQIARLNEKFGHKLDFLERADLSGSARVLCNHGRAVLVGDLNIAPLETDVWSHKQLLKGGQSYPNRGRTF